MANIQDNQIKVLADIIGGVPSYTSQDVINNTKIPLSNGIDGMLDITIGADSNVLKLAGGALPSGSVYLNGNTNVTGSVACAGGATIGTASTDALHIGARYANLGKLFDANNDEVLIEELDDDGIVIGKKEVYGLIQTSLEHGEATADDKLQISFVVLDDVNGGFKLQTVNAGDYKFEYNRIYTLATASVQNRLGDILSGNIGGYAVDELYPMAAITHGYFMLTTDSLHELPADKKVTYDFTSGKWEDSDSTEISGTKSVLNTPTIVNTDIDAIINSIGINSEINGVSTNVSKTKIISKTKLELDLTDDIAGNTIYNGTSFVLVW